jgi:hypothetical protein
MWFIVWRDLRRVDTETDPLDWGVSQFDSLNMARNFADMCENQGYTVQLYTATPCDFADYDWE